MTAPTLLCLIRCHARAGRLARVLYHWLEEIPALGVDTRAVVCPDRPSMNVLRVLEDWDAHPRLLGRVQSTAPMLSPEHGQLLMGRLNDMLDFADKQDFCPEWLVHANDDDLLDLGECRRDLLSEMLSRRDVAAYCCASRFPWGVSPKGEVLYNANAHHWAPHIGRYRRGDRHALTPHLQVVWQTWELMGRTDFGPNVLTAPFYLHDMSTYTEEMRLALYRAHANCGLLDVMTKQLVEDPLLLTAQDWKECFPTPAEALGFQWRHRRLSLTLPREKLYAE